MTNQQATKLSFLQLCFFWIISPFCFSVVFFPPPLFVLLRNIQISATKGGAWKRTLSWRMNADILQWNRGERDGVMQRHREGEAGLKVFICLRAGCGKLKRCEEEVTQTAMNPASYWECDRPGAHCGDLHAALCYISTRWTSFQGIWRLSIMKHFTFDLWMDRLIFEGVQLTDTVYPKKQKKTHN